MSLSRTITVRNVNQALEEGLNWLRVSGVETGSRNGVVLVAPGPVTTAYLKPTERVLFSTLRDCNPFFHLFESIWMLAGRNDTEVLRPLVPRMQEFSDDQKTLNGAYGFRWREYFGYDQLEFIVKMLRKDPSTRRAVLSMWNPAADTELSPPQFVPDLTNQGSKDLPCNTHIYFDASRGKLDMTVCNRSNDVIWGAYGANVVHMSFLHEFVALAAGLEIGTYYQFSNNYHVYKDRPDTQRLIRTTGSRATWAVEYRALDMYDMHAENAPRPLMSYEEARSSQFFLRECEEFVAGTLSRPVYAFTKMVLQPMMEAHAAHKEGDTERAVAKLRAASPSDWRSSGLLWLQKRLASNKHTNGAPV